MKKSILIICCFLAVALATETAAQTVVQPGIVCNEAWTKLHSPYYITGDIIIPCGCLLFINHGVEVIVTGDYSINVYGKLLVNGWVADPVYLIPEDSDQPWKGIRAFGSDECDDSRITMKYTTIKYASSEGGTLDADNYGGGLFVDGMEDIELKNVTFMHCNAELGGGALYVKDSDPVLKKCTFLYNQAPQGGALYLTGEADPSLHNSILWDNQALEGPQVYVAGNGADPDFTYCNVQGGKAAFAGPGMGFNFSGQYSNNIDKNPICMHTSTGSYNLSMCSPCIDAGCPDINCKDPDGTRADIGAIYYPHDGIYIQEPVVKGAWSLTESPVHVNTSIVVPASEVLTIGPGVEVLVLGHHKIEVSGTLQAIGTMQDNVLFTTPGQEAGWHGIRFLPESANTNSKLLYCTIENGMAYGEGSRDNMGGGLFVDGNDNLYVGFSTIRNCQAAAVEGELSGGGAVAVLNCSPTLNKNKFVSNSSAEYGGALLLENASPKVVYNLIAENSSGLKGGAIAMFGSTNPYLINNTIAYNSSDFVGGAAYLENSKSPLFRNNIIWMNEAPEGAQLYLNDDACDPNFFYNDIMGGWASIAGAGTSHFAGFYFHNLAANPLFDPTSSYYRLLHNSPCIDAGDPQSRPDPDGTRNDMGAFPCSIKSPQRTLASGEETSAQLTKVYPNPAVETVNIDLEVTTPGVVTVAVYNTLGQLVASISENQLSAGKYHTTFSVSDWNPGTYIIKLSTGNDTLTKMLLVK